MRTTSTYPPLALSPNIYPYINKHYSWEPPPWWKPSDDWLPWWYLRASLFFLLFFLNTMVTAWGGAGGVLSPLWTAFHLSDSRHHGEPSYPPNVSTCPPPWWTRVMRHQRQVSHERSPISWYHHLHIVETIVRTPPQRRAYTSDPLLHRIHNKH